ncbi:DUF2637 domain-containing protein [Nocardia huaxiensis]|uniref:DUF2637 domain-containing protein n=1 Tax=Nocardia huaxiensis TaxID=2755382 RepID=A0A7D6Z638_9NOCA|nr:DUF2637 domain-containing protein [Nocardia huaxiensis]QLY34006.1 DUF2637 domain-containing protein [Nocardia huaxiensis]UFS99091.1 DUF2637 domain-containing protein [Nocardia huaxiensis]
MTGNDAGANAVRSNDAAHRNAPTDKHAGAQALPRTEAETAAVRFFWGELILVALMSIAGNAVHAVLNAPPGLAVVAAFVAMFPPVALLTATHGVGLLVRARANATLAYWSVVVLTSAIAAIAFRLSFDALRDLAIQVGMTADLAWLVPLIIDGAIGQATVALLVLARTPRTDNTPPNPAVRNETEPVRTPDTVRTVSVREVHTETRSTATELGPPYSMAELEAAHPNAIEMDSAHDRWTEIAESVCHADPAGRRDPEKVAAILRLKFEQNWSHSRIAEHVELSSSAVTRTLTAAREHIGGGTEGGALQWTE